MSRHLMARFRHLHGSEGVPWVHGKPLGWSEWARPDRPLPGQETAHDPADHSSAVVHHGEQRYGLEVMPNDNYPGLWTWGIHEYHPYGVEHMNDPDWPEEYKGEHLLWTSPGEWDHPPGTPSSYYGRSGSREEAMRAAEADWEKHKVYVDSQNPLKNDSFQQELPRRSNPGDEDYGDIFGDRNARLRTASLPGQFGWEPMEDSSGKPCFWCNHGHGGGEHYEAQLENGDHLSLHSIHDPSMGVENWVGIVSKHPYYNRPPEDSFTYHNNNRDQAISQFEKDYLGMNRRGIEPSSMDHSAYDDIINPRTDIDDDFGDIFGNREASLRTAADEHGLNLQWSPLRFKFQKDDDPHLEYEANLENGDWLNISSYPTDYGTHPSDKEWSYTLYGHPRPIKELREEGKGFLSRRYDRHKDDEGSEYLGHSHGLEGVMSDAHITDPYEAMRLAEKHYFSLNRRGQGRSQFDYDDYFKNLNGPDDEGYGDIFGDRRSSLRHAADQGEPMLDWRTEDSRGNPYPVPFDYRAQIENGDFLRVDGVGGTHQTGPDRWAYRIHAVPKPFQEHPDDVLHRHVYGQMPMGYSSEVLADSDYVHPTYADAMRLAEQHYFGLNRQGQAPSGHEGYDIDDIMRRFNNGEL